MVTLPASDVADKLGSAKAGNIVMLGALLALTHGLAKETAVKVLEAKVRNPKLLELDKHALEAGWALAA